MIVYRLAKKAYGRLDGEGARLFGGRWNSLGRPMVYSAASPGLAVLEVLVHLDLHIDEMPDDFQITTIEVPDAAPSMRLDVLPEDPEDCVNVGDQFLARAEALVLWVPSIVVPQERNALINPLHSSMGEVKVLGADPFRFDPRLSKRNAR